MLFELGSRIKNTFQMSLTFTLCSKLKRLPGRLISKICTTDKSIHLKIDRVLGNLDGVFWILDGVFRAEEGYMGQFLQGGKNPCFVSLFFTESPCVAKPYKIELIFRLILVDWVFCIVKTSWLTFRKIFGVPCSTPFLALLTIFWVKMR